MSKPSLPVSPSKVLLRKVLTECRLQQHDHSKPLYKYLSCETAKKVLSSSTFKYSSPLLFNDPFEFSSDFIKFEVSNKEELNRSVKETMTAIGLNSDVPWFYKLVYDGVLEDLNDRWRKQLDSIKKESRVLCLSESYDNTLMWSHYAEGHTGVCLGIVVPEMFHIWSGETLKVSYTNKPRIQTFSMLDRIEQRRLLLRWVFMKSKHWAYEKEVRIHFQHQERLYFAATGIEHEVPDDPLATFVPFDPVQLIEIYYGISCKQDDIREIQAILKSKGYQVNTPQQMEKGREQFTLASYPLEQ
jgi:hypothetical protein